MPNVQHILDERVAAAMRAAFPDAPDSPAIVMPAQDTRFGDYQANGAMALAKRLKQKPRDVAERIIAHLDISELCEKPEIAGPGFINLRLRPDWVSRQLGEINKVSENTEDRLGVPRAEKPERIVVDYSAPNLAKEMHVGHLRSTIIGDALVRMLQFVAHDSDDVILQNHVGDWGTQFGMLVAYRDSLRQELIAEAPDSDTVNVPQWLLLRDIEEIYKRAKHEYDTNPAFAEKSRQYVVKLQEEPPLEDDEAHRLWMALRNAWKALRDKSLDHCGQIYRRLGVTLTKDDVVGESAYNNLLQEVVSILQSRNMLVPSEGAQCVFLKGPDGKPLFVNKEGEPLPLIVKKSDEGYLYATTDLAAIGFRTGTFEQMRDDSHWLAIKDLMSPHARRILYVVDARQALHFAMVFAVARAAGFATAEVALEHVAFGTMMGADGKPFKTREGGTVKLMDLLDEAEKRAYDLVSAKSPDLKESERKDIARIVGIGAVKYADLAQNRTSDYVFSWEKMLALDGNTAPYMQYAYARIRSIFRKGGHEAETLRHDPAPIRLEKPEPQELALGKMILRFPEILDRALEDYRPNILAAYLYDLAGAFTAFYDACPVIQSPEPLRSERLKLCDLAARVIQRGLGLLGIETAERM